jgi:tryptophan synthase alpha chain
MTGQTATGAGRMAATFARTKAAGRPALIPYMIPGFPDQEGADDVLDALVAGGADIVEVGVPFSDPLADGATIQRAAFAALDAGTTLRSCIDFVRRARGRHPELPLVLMSYLNPVIAYGIEAFARDAAAAGADAAILVDLTAEESTETRQVLRDNGLDLIYLVAPTSSDERLRLVAGLASGFIYCVSVAGTTGARTELAPGLADYVARVRRCTDLPLAVGFGVSRRAHVEALTGVADGVVMGAAVIDRLSRGDRAERLQAVREFLETLSGRRSET